MLSISERFTAPPRTFGLASDSPQPATSRSDGKRARKPPPQDLAEEEDVIKEVHRDDEYGEWILYVALVLRSSSIQGKGKGKRKHGG